MIHLCDVMQYRNIYCACMSCTNIRYVYVVGTSCIRRCRQSDNSIYKMLCNHAKLPVIIRVNIHTKNWKRSKRELRLIEFWTTSTDLPFFFSIKIFPKNGQQRTRRSRCRFQSFNLGFILWLVVFRWFQSGRAPYYKNRMNFSFIDLNLDIRQSFQRQWLLRRLFVFLVTELPGQWSTVPWKTPFLWGLYPPRWDCKVLELQIEAIWAKLTHWI